MCSHECGLIQSTCVTAPLKRDRLVGVELRRERVMRRRGRASTSTQAIAAAAAQCSFAWLLLLLSTHSRLLLRRVDVDTGRHQDAIPVSLVTRILEELVIGAPADHRVEEMVNGRVNTLGSSILAS